MRRFTTALILTCVTVFAAGCATTSSTQVETNDRQNQLAQDAPLGSRIKRKSNRAPVMGATREDIERERVQQGAIQAAAVNNSP